MDGQFEEERVSAKTENQLPGRMLLGEFSGSVKTYLIRMRMDKSNKESDEEFVLYVSGCTKMMTKISM